MQNGFLNWGKLEMEMEFSPGKKCLLNIQIDFCPSGTLYTLPTTSNLDCEVSKEFELWAVQKI